MLHNDIPTKGQIERLAQADGGFRVTMFIESGVLHEQGELARISLKDQTRLAEERLTELGASSREIAAIREHLDDIEADASFWNFQSRSLAVFVSENSATTFRLPNNLTQSLTVGQRYYVKPLLRTLSFAQAAHVLALSMNDVHLLAISPDDEPRKIESADIPKDFDHAVSHHFHGGSTVTGKLQNEEGKKTRTRQFARVVDRGVRNAIGNSQLPLILAAAEPLQSIFREVSSLPQLVEQAITGNPETHTDQELSQIARGLLDEIYAAELAHIADTHAQRANSGRAASDLSDIARAAAVGAIDTLVFNMDARVAGSVDPGTGAVTFSDATVVASSDVLDDIVRLALATDSRLIAVREGEVPGGGEAAAILRYAV